MLVCCYVAFEVRKVSLSKKVLVIGAFGYREGHIGGQTDKIRLLYQELQTRLGRELVDHVDTADWRKQPFSLFLEVSSKVRKSEVMLFAPARNGLRILPLLLLLKKDSQKLFYLVIGGWLPSVMKDNDRLKKSCSNLNGVFVETDYMLHDLEHLGLENVEFVPNFKRFTKATMITRLNNASRVRAVFYSRVCKEKGIELAIEAVRLVNAALGSKLTLDVIGPIKEGYEETFHNIVKFNRECVTYKGVIEPNSVDTHSYLSQYDFMIFPTLYHTEGLPGAIIDAYASGLPVVAARWDSASCVVKEGETGKIFTLGSMEDLKTKLLEFVENPNSIKEMKSNCLREAQKYHVDTVIPELIRMMGVSI